MDAVEVEVFRHIFASIAEEMGVALMRSAFSPNIKERRDYSCAIFDARGEMVAQAAHIPVHLGSTPMSVRAAIDAFDTIAAGEHVLLNDPYQGGTHLPDITLVSPVHDASGVVRFYVANRAHHADVGGISPGSLPLSRHIDDEGFRTGPELLSDALIERVAEASRTPDERRGDLLAQVAANTRGIERLREHLDKHPARVTRAATALQDYSERVTRALIAQLPDGSWSYEDVLEDDGHGNRDLSIRCTLEISGDSMRFDLRGSHEQVLGPVNVPRAVTVSAVLYTVRCLVPPKTPGNEGVMRPLEVLTTPGSIVDAVFPAPVAAGNVETSQRITDVVFGALAQVLPERIPAASTGTMNNVLIGGTDPRSGAPFAYYETIGGGTGAGPGFDGEHGVQTHMTNTLNTPVEALEHAYPFEIEQYAIRRGSGGRGRHVGGDGVVRAYRFDCPATVTLMTERRRIAPSGRAGGHDGVTGRNVLCRGGVEQELPAKCTIEVSAGDVVRIETPGGGGFGS